MDRSVSRAKLVSHLIRLVLFIAFLYIVTALVTPSMPTRSEEARKIAAATQLKSFQEALDAFRKETGAYPAGTNGLQDLVAQPAGVTNWRGPYLLKVPIDPWGRPYIYDYPGTHTNRARPYDLLSLGSPDEKNPILPPD